MYNIETINTHTIAYIQYNDKLLPIDKTRTRVQGAETKL